MKMAFPLHSLGLREVNFGEKMRRERMKSVSELKNLKGKSSGSKGGFTLVELLIVIAIIGILAAIAVPQFTQYKKRSYDADAKSNLHNLYLACKAYWADNGPNANCDSDVVTATAYGFTQ